MKLRIKVFILAVALVAVAATRWTSNDTPVLQLRTADGHLIQFGLRGDGVVVWREVVNATNSPSEVPQAIIPQAPTNFGRNIKTPPL